MRYEGLEDSYVQTSMGRIHYKHHSGSGKSIIFLHGLGADTKSFAKLVEQLPDRMDVYLVDLLGHGASDAPRIEYKTSIQVQVVREVIEAKQIQNSYLFGHSYGGWVAAMVAQENYRGKGAIIEDAPGLKEFFEEVKRSSDSDLRKEWLIKAASSTNQRGDVIRSIVESEYTNASEYLTKESLGNIVRPTLIIWGDRDKMVNVKYARLFNEYIKGSALEVVEGAEHVPHFSQAKKVSELLVGFIG